MRVSQWSVRLCQCAGGEFTVVYDHLLSCGSRLPGRHDFFAAIGMIESTRRELARAS